MIQSVLSTTYGFVQTNRDGRLTISTRVKHLEGIRELPLHFATFLNAYEDSDSVPSFAQ